MLQRHAALPTPERADEKHSFEPAGPGVDLRLSRGNRGDINIYIYIYILCIYMYIYICNHYYHACFVCFPIHYIFVFGSP